MYCPLIKSIETLRLEKSVDPELYYLRDALPEYSTFPLDMEQELITEDSEVPVNEHKVQCQLLNLECQLSLAMQVALKVVLAYLSPFSNKIVSIYQKCEYVF